MNTFVSHKKSQLFTECLILSKIFHLIGERPEKSWLVVVNNNEHSFVK